jgi:hypothetical protein
MDGFKPRTNSPPETSTLLSFRALAWKGNDTLQHIPRDVKQYDDRASGKKKIKKL